MNNSLMSGLAGLAKGAREGWTGRRKEMEDNRRTRVMEGLEERKTKTAEATGAAGVRASDAGITDATRRTDIMGGELGLRQRTFDAEYGANGTLSFRDSQGNVFTLPNSMRGVGAAMPWMTNEADNRSALARTREAETGSMARLNRELLFRENHPELYGGSSNKIPKTREEALQMIFNKVFSNPMILGEQPGQRTQLFNEAMGLGSQVWPGVVPPPPATAYDQFVQSINGDARFSNREDAKAAFNEKLRDPNFSVRWGTLPQEERDKIMQHINSLPSRARTSPSRPVSPTDIYGAPSIAP